MKYFLVPFLILALAFSVMAQDRFDRSAILAPEDTLNIGGFGGIVSGVDLDGDGRSELYFVNNDWKDTAGKDFVPRIYKYELNDSGEWELVWSTKLSFDFQNTWPALTAGDLDNDGKGEIIWGPVNNTAGGLNPNPARVVVFETPGDGSDNMGVDNGDGTWRPNAEWTIVAEDNVNLRPFTWEVADIDGDGTQEIISLNRAGSAFGQIFSVDDVPDAADGSETWTMEFEFGTADFGDVVVSGSTAWFFNTGGDVFKVVASGADTYAVTDTMLSLLPDDSGVWKSVNIVDIDGDQTEEFLVAGWFGTSRGVYLLQQSGDTLAVGGTIANFDAFSDEIRTLNGADVGDVDGDGLLDFIIGTRDYDTPDGDENHIVRVEYQGGDITSAASYEVSIIDKNVIAPQGSQLDVISLADIDSDGEDEVIYAGLTRPFGSGGPPIVPVTILDRVPGNQPIITSVADVPNDNGRQVWVTWQGSEDDRGGTRLTAHLSGDNEVAPVTTVASGKATFTLSPDGSTLYYMVEVANIDSVTQAHIHRGAPGVNGPPGVFLFGPAAGGGPVNGILSRGAITQDDLIGPWAGDMAAFVTDLMSGNTYVNVHSTTNPGGEIRGQVTTDLVSKPNRELAKTSGYTISHYVVWRLDGGAPVEVARTQAIQAEMYAAVVPTLGDGDEYEATFVVSAHTANPTVLWKSFMASGTSEDNLIPTAPQGLAASETQDANQQSSVELSWLEIPDEDFDYFAVVRGTSSGFDPAAADVIGTTTGTAFVDEATVSGTTYFYRVVAFDFNGNQGEFSEEASLLITGVGGEGSALPDVFALSRNYPNPFNPTTQIAYDLPESAEVSLKIFNMRGQEIRTLVNESKAAGSYTVQWNGLDNSGVRVASGIYVYMIKAGNFVKSYRMTLLK